MNSSLEYREKFRFVVLNHFSDKEEVWCFHPNYLNILISSLGKVKNAITGTEFSIRTTYQGYKTCSIPLFQTTGVKRTTSKLVHRLVAETFFSYVSSDLYEANHINGDKSNNSIHNINWLTRQENLQHARDTGLFKRQFGESNGRYKYSNEDVKTLDNMRQEGYTLKQLGYLMDLKQGSIFNLLKRRGYV